MLRGAALACLLWHLALPAQAHRLVIFAHVEDGRIVVASKFSSGKIPAEGEVTVRDAAGKVLCTVPLDPGGETRIPRPHGQTDGVEITVSTGEGHEDYWVLTGADLYGEGTK